MSAAVTRWTATGEKKNNKRLQGPLFRTALKSDDANQSPSFLNGEAAATTAVEMRERRRGGVNRGGSISKIPNFDRETIIVCNVARGCGAGKKGDRHSYSYERVWGLGF